MSPSSTIYNATDGPLAIDRAGRQLGARERVDVDDLDGSPLAGHITAERIVVIDSADDQPTRTRKGSASTSSQEA